MKYIKQFGIILSVTLLGELLNAVIPLPVPASIYGLVLMLTGLMTKLIPLHAVKETGKFLLDIMPLLFVPAAVGLIDTWGVLRPVIVPVTVTVLVSTVAVMAASGRATQAVIRFSKQKEETKNEGIVM
ncbi:CidA/LrgA family protein [Congzhengia minquanensis]|uniref:CidA/LrgA family protein n=1 Tax=Congzhengia minquanensis TaxID=2763657 RepID=A0A926HXV5_9FIRM|nr:CidA/LrgA family protein [Congzhengia minquanensis]MBC8539763.1 CidA/LrgA family protein [Congzhengia minquanensis]